jgi:hypothetical protein
VYRGCVGRGSADLVSGFAKNRFSPLLATALAKCSDCNPGLMTMTSATQNRTTDCESRWVRGIITALMSWVLVFVVGSSRTPTNVFSRTSLRAPAYPSFQFSRTVRRRRETYPAVTSPVTVMRTDASVAGLDKPRLFVFHCAQSSGIWLVPHSSIRPIVADKRPAASSGLLSSCLQLRC